MPNTNHPVSAHIKRCKWQFEMTKSDAMANSKERVRIFAQKSDEQPIKNGNSDTTNQGQVKDKPPAYFGLQQ